MLQTLFLIICIYFILSELRGNHHAFSMTRLSMIVAIFFGLIFTLSNRSQIDFSLSSIFIPLVLFLTVLIGLFGTISAWKAFSKKKAIANEIVNVQGSEDKAIQFLDAEIKLKRPINVRNGFTQEYGDLVYMREEIKQGTYKHKMRFPITDDNTYLKRE